MANCSLMKVKLFKNKFNNDYSNTISPTKSNLLRGHPHIPSPPFRGFLTPSPFV